MTADPVAGKQAPKQGPVQAAGVSVVEVRGHRGLLEASAAQTGAGLAVVAFVRLTFDQQAQALLAGQGLVSGIWACSASALAMPVRRRWVRRS